MSKTRDKGQPQPPSVSADETVEELGPYFFIQKKPGHRLTVDSVLLTDFLPQIKKTDSVIDLGTGTGAIALMLAYKTPAARIVGVEVDPASAQIARRNVSVNGLLERVTIIEGDYRDLKDRYSEGAFEVVVSNPPYVKSGSGRISPYRGRDAARSELFGGLADLVEAAAYLAGPTGRVYFVFPVERLFEMLGEIRQRGLRTGRLRFVHTDKVKRAKIFLIEAGRDVSVKLKIEEPLYLR